MVTMLRVFVSRGDHSSTAYTKMESQAGTEATAEESEEETLHTKPAVLKTSSI